MTPRERLVTVKEGASLEEAMRLMHKHRLERVLVVNGDFHLRGLITVKDILKSSEHPNACKDELGRLRVGAAIGVGEGPKSAPLCWWRREWMCWWSIRRMATRKVCSIACAGSSAPSRTSKSSAATSLPALLPKH